MCGGRETMRIIDKDELSRRFDGTCVGECACCRYATVTESGCKVIDDMPEIDPTRHGHWKYKPLWKGADAKYCECSVCGKPVWWVSDYCPNCGARMDEEMEE